MARVYSTQFIVGTLAFGDSIFYEVPDGYLAIVRDINGVQFTDSSGPGNFTVDFDGVFWFQRGLPNYTEAELFWQGRAVAPAPTTITATCSGVSGGIEVVISGYLLTLP